jgi:hypothetical protein
MTDATEKRMSTLRTAGIALVVGAAVLSLFAGCNSNSAGRQTDATTAALSDVVAAG